MKWEELHRYWFGSFELTPTYIKERNKLWFLKDQKTDDHIRETFSGALNEFEEGKFSDWKQTSKGYVTLIILLDQIPRNSFRNSPRSFQYDKHALKMAQEGVGTRDKDLNAVEKSFFYLPFEHNEDISMQKNSVELFGKLYADQTSQILQENCKENLEYAERHFEIIERFGRFPHRNKILGRESTAEEIEFLKLPESAF